MLVLYSVDWNNKKLQSHTYIQNVCTLNGLNNPSCTSHQKVATYVNFQLNSLLQRQVPWDSRFSSAPQPLCAKNWGNLDYYSNWKCSNIHLQHSCLATALRATCFQLNNTPHLETVLPTPYLAAPLSSLSLLPGASSGSARNLLSSAPPQWYRTHFWGLQTWRKIHILCTETLGQSVWRKLDWIPRAEAVRNSADPAAQPSLLLAGQEPCPSKGNSADSSREKQHLPSQQHSSVL